MVGAIDSITVSPELDNTDTYLDPNDGLLHCSKCRGVRQTVLKWDGHEKKVKCLCACEVAAEKEREDARRARERQYAIQELRTNGLQDPSLRNYTFDQDFGDNPLLDKARAYVENWDEFKAHNIGLLLFGSVGTGKTFFAGCIANALIDRCVPVLMTSLPRILNALSGKYDMDRNEYINSLNRYDLLIIDDIGSERSTDYALEQIFTVIDARYRSGRPMIITTNLGLGDMKMADIDKARIYDRILEVCQPIAFQGKNYRKDIAQRKRLKAVQLLNEGTITN
jgi:DNA replication protein DnaC